MFKKLRHIVGAVVIIGVLLAAWHYLLVSTRPSNLKTWESCKAKLLQSWAESHANQVQPLLHFTEDHFYSFGGESRPDHFDDHDSRGTARHDADQLGIREHEMIQLDHRIANDCGPFPRS